MAAPRTHWTTADIGDLQGRHIVVTGATSGLGLVSARVLAGHGAHVVLAGRSPERLAEAAARVAVDAAGVRGPAPDTLMVDLTSLESVRAAAAELPALVPHVDVLLNNAGVMATPQRRTADGFELQIGTNHLGHFALTGLLWPLLTAAGTASVAAGAGPARVVTVSSMAHRGGRVDPDDLHFAQRTYHPWTAYAQSKLANLLFSAELARRARLLDAPVLAVAAHPGFANTNLVHGRSDAPRRFRDGRLVRRATDLTMRITAQTADDGALPQLRAATDPAVRTDEFYGPAQLFGWRGAPVRVGRTESARDTRTAARLWTVSEEQTGVSFPSP